MVVLTLPALARANDVPDGWTWDEPTLSVESAPDGWTWDDFLNTSKKLTRGTPGQADAQFGFGLFPAWWRIYPWMWQNGGDAWSKDGLHMTPAGYKIWNDALRPILQVSRSSQ